MVAAIAAAGLLFAGFAYAASDWFELSSVGGSGASGKAHVSYKETGDGTVRVTATVKAEDLSSASDVVYEGWFVDMESGYKLSLGALRSGEDGDGRLHFRQDMVNFDLYDKLVITEEPEGDTDPNPAAPVLIGDLP